MRDFADNSRGAVAIYFGLAMLVFVGTTGLAVNSARGYLLKARLSQALDAAALAGGKVLLDDTVRDPDIQMFFDANFPPGTMDATVDGPHITVTDNNTVVNVTATAQVPTALMRVFGMDTMTVGAAASVNRIVTGLDVVLSIDMSGSMCTPCTKIQAAQTAAKKMVDILFEPFNNVTTPQHITVAGTTYSLLNIGMVPWNSKVNVRLNSAVSGAVFSTAATTSSAAAFTHPIKNIAQAQIYTSNISPVKLLDAPQANWKGCVYARYIDDNNQANDGDMTLGYATVGGKQWVGYEPIPPLEGEPQTGNWPSTPTRYNMGGTTTAWTNYGGTAKNCWASWLNDSKADPDRPGNRTTPNAMDVPATIGPATAWTAGNRNWVRSNPTQTGECTDCLAHGILPLNDDKTKIVAALNSLYGAGNNPTGNTNAPQGLFWGWEVLMPGEPFSEAKVSTPFPRTQAIVFMTDGQSVGGNGDGFKGVFGGGNGAATTTVHGDLTNGTKNNMNNRLLQLANLIKGNIPGQGVQIYVIQYQEADPNLSILLKQVATQPTSPYYFFAPDEASLDGIFSKIAANLSKLRVSK